MQQLLWVFLSMVLYTSWSNAYFFDSLMPSIHRDTRISNTPKGIQNKAARKEKKKALVIASEIKIQTSLHELGFYYGRINGNLSHPRSLMAIKEMNAYYHRFSEEVLDKEVQSILIALYDVDSFDKKISDIPQSKKSKNKQVQTALSILGYYKGSIDGSMGKQTRKAIREYQKEEAISKYFNQKQKRALVKKAKAFIQKEQRRLRSMLQSKPMPKQIFYVPDGEIMKVSP